MVVEGKIAGLLEKVQARTAGSFLTMVTRKRAREEMADEATAKEVRAEKAFMEAKGALQKATLVPQTELTAGDWKRLARMGETMAQAWRKRCDQARRHHDCRMCVDPKILKQKKLKSHLSRTSPWDTLYHRTKRKKVPTMGRILRKPRVT